MERLISKHEMSLIISEADPDLPEIRNFVRRVHAKRRVHDFAEAMTADLTRIMDESMSYEWDTSADVVFKTKNGRIILRVSSAFTVAASFEVSDGVAGGIGHLRSALQEWESTAPPS